MNKPLLLAVLTASLWPVATRAAAPVKARQRILMDADWRFLRGSEGRDFGAALNGVAITSWRWKGETPDMIPQPNLPMNAIVPAAAPDLDTSGADWKDAAPGGDVFGGREGFAWFRTVINLAPGVKAPASLHFESVDDKADVFVNGRKLVHHEGWNDPFDVTLGDAWRPNAPNFIAVRVENTAGQGGIGAASLQNAGQAAPPVARAAFNDRAWRRVHLPHDFVVEGTFSPKADQSHGFLPGDIGWYRKSFALPASDKGKTLWIDFDGVYRNSRVWLNGQLLGRHFSGYTSFGYDISSVANYGGRNVLTVCADARSFEGWWYEGGGIYRHVWLNKAAPLHIAPQSTFVRSQVADESAANPRATVIVSTTISNDDRSIAGCRVVAKILDARGKIVAASVKSGPTPFGKNAQVTLRATVAKAQLWSIENPYLYRVELSLQRGNQILDSQSTRLGIRTIRFDADRGFLLNGRVVKIQGTCNHQDFAGLGVALPDSVLEWRIKKLKEMGSNAYRCSHNPPARELLDACDRLGMIVMDENRRLGDTPEILGQVESMVRRDRNHPSIIMWSMCNEESEQGSPRGEAMGRAIKNVILSLDDTRPVSAAMNGGHGTGLSYVVDVHGFNYGSGNYEPYHRSHPTEPLYGSETASALSTRGIYANDKERGYVRAYDIEQPGWGNTAESAWRALGEKPYMAGGFVWTGFDYKGEPTPYGWPCINSHFGIMDICGFPKDTYYYYQSWWGQKPVVHLLPHWNWAGKEGQPIAVWCHSNCERVELFLNNQSLGSKPMPRLGHLEWQVPYQAGKLEARGFIADRQVMSNVVETTGAPAAIRLVPDRAAFKADGEDVCIVRVEILDAQGRIVPTADNNVRFAVAGAARIVGVGNGDASSHEPDKADQRRAFNGLCMAIVGGSERAGALKLTASSPGLKAASVMLRSTK